MKTTQRRSDPTKGTYRKRCKSPPIRYPFQKTNPSQKLEPLRTFEGLEPPPDPNWMNSKEAVRFLDPELNVTPEDILNDRQRGELFARRQGRWYRYKPESLERWKKKLEAMREKEASLESERRRR